MATRRENIIEKALEILDSHPDGVRYTELVKKISKTMQDVPVNTIHGTVWDLDIQQSRKIYKPSRGLFRLPRFKPDDSASLTLEPVVPKSKQAMAVKEEDFYGPFADWLVNEIEDCTKKKNPGGNKI